MTYSNKFVLSILADGNVIKEKANGDVLIPFNTEYSIRLRNKNNRKCAVQLFVDGEEATTAGKIIIPAHDSVDLERWLHDNHKGKKFKFVDLQSTEAQDFGKDQSDVYGNGIIEARFFLEKEYPKINTIEEHHHHHHHYDWWPKYPYPYNPPIWYGTSNTFMAKGMSGGGGTCSSAGNLENVSFTCNNNSEIIPDINLCSAGATVEGGESTQKFTSSYIDLETTYTTLKLQLKGSNIMKKSKDKQLILESAQYCDNCGAKKARKTSKFCHVCGGKF